MSFHYPGWVMRLYLDLEGNSSIANKFCELACADSNLDLCDVADLPGTPFKDATKVFPMNWRFFPTLDKQVWIWNIIAIGTCSSNNLTRQRDRKAQLPMRVLRNQKICMKYEPSGHSPLKVPYVKYNYHGSVRHCLLPTHTSKSNLTLCIYLHDMIGTDYFAFKISF